MSCSVRAFTLLELLVVLAIVAIIGTILILSLRSSRAAGERAVALGHLRSHAAIFTQWTVDHRDEFPAYTPVFTDRALQAGYFNLYCQWPLLLAKYGYLPSPLDPALFPPHYARVPIKAREGVTPYVYSCTFMADPAYWDEYTRTGDAQLRATRTAEVAYPAEKSLLFDSAGWKLNLSRPPTAEACTLAWVDGSAVQITRDRIAPGYPRGDGRGYLHHTEHMPTLHTRMGVKGRDVVTGERDEPSSGA